MGCLGYLGTLGSKASCHMSSHVTSQDLQDATEFEAVEAPANILAEVGNSE